MAAVVITTSESLWNYYRDKANDASNEILASYRVNNSKKTTAMCFD